MPGTNGMIGKQKQETIKATLDRAKAECRFTDRLYEILLAYQNGLPIGGRPTSAVPPGNVGELNPETSRLYNLIWCAALDMSNQDGKPKKKKDKQQMEVNHA